MSYGYAIVCQQIVVVVVGAGSGQRGRQGRRKAGRQGEILGIIAAIIATGNSSGNREAEQERGLAAFAPLSI